MTFPNLPNEPSIVYIALLLLLVGLFLFIAGLGILSIEKVSVSPGMKTWIVGLVLMIVGSLLIYQNIKINSEELLYSAHQSIENSSVSNSQLSSSTLTANIHQLENAEEIKFIEGIRSSSKTQIYSGKWNGVNSKMFIEWQDYQNQGGEVKGFIQSENGFILEKFTGINDAFRQITLTLSNNTSLKLKATLRDKLKIWEARDVYFEHQL